MHLDERLAKEYPDTLASVIAAEGAIANMVGMMQMNPPVKGLLPCVILEDVIIDSHLGCTVCGHCADQLHVSQPFRMSTRLPNSRSQLLKVHF